MTCQHTNTKDIRGQSATLTPSFSDSLMAAANKLTAQTLPTSPEAGNQGDLNLDSNFGSSFQMVSRISSTPLGILTVSQPKTVLATLNWAPGFWLISPHHQQAGVGH